MKTTYCFDDFTEDEYCNLLKVAKIHWTFIRFPEYKRVGNVCLWRHDIDFSVHRAYQLARIEAEEHVSTTYFLYLHSQFYNLLEREILDLVLKIADLGHDIGLHFEPAFYRADINNIEQFVEKLNFEKTILQHFIHREIQVFSLHNPDIGEWIEIEHDEVAGLINTYGGYFQRNYRYVSDSNGYWRFHRLRDVLESAEDQKLQILTHPEWWTPESMSPRKRIVRCIEGRAANIIKQYDQFLANQPGRENVT